MAKQPHRKIVRKAIRGRPGTFFSVFLFSCLINILMLTGSIYMLQVYDRVLPSGSVPTLIALSAIVAGLYIFYGFLEGIRARIFVRIGRLFEEDMRNRIFDAMSFAAVKRIPGVGTQSLGDMATIRHYISGSGPAAFFDMPWVPIYIGVVYLLHPILGYASLAAAIIIFCLALVTDYVSRGPIGEAAQASAKAAAMSEEARRSAEALQALGMKPVIRDRWAALQQQALDLSTKASDSGGIYSVMSRVMRLLVQSGILGLGAYLAIQQEITPGGIIAASIIMSRGLAPIEQAVGNWQQYLGFRKAEARLEEFLAKIPVAAKPMELPPPKGLLDVENLYFVAPGSDKPLLQGLTFKVQPGQGLGVIGPSGAGKSTLVKALVGIIDPTRGTVRLDGATHDQRSSDDLGKHIGYLPQDIQLFDGTAAQNISRFSPTPDAAKIVEAAKLANVHDLIMKLPQGYDTQLGEGGARLSSGQKQRIALARALFGDPAIIVMDEPNSNLDAEGEAALELATRAALKRGASVVIVAHRPSTLQSMHHILVLSEGKQVAFGPRDDIFKQVTRPRQVAHGSGSGAPSNVVQLQPPPPDKIN